VFLTFTWTTPARTEGWLGLNMYAVIDTARVDRRGAAVVVVVAGRAVVGVVVGAAVVDVRRAVVVVVASDPGMA
jgi:hypothetical protein